MTSELLTHLNGDLLEAGCDEAGRGPLAGPVFAAAVILPDGFRHPLLNDSKQMSEKDRDRLRPIIEREAVAYSVQSVGPEEIDAINILNASIAGMQKAVMALAVKPEYLLIDGNRFRSFSFIASISGQSVEKAAAFDSIPYSCIVKGDARFASIAAASVLAKTARDECMRRLALEYPEYGWDREHGISDKRAHRSHKEIRAHPVSQEEFQTEGSRTRTVGVNGKKTIKRYANEKNS